MKDKAKKLRYLVEDFISMAPCTVDVGFFGRFLNSNSSVRVSYDGRNLPSDGYTKFHIILHALQNISELREQSGALYTFLHLSASRHTVYNIKDTKKLCEKLYNALSWTFRDILYKEWSEECETLLSWGWNVIAKIYINAKELRCSSTNHRLTLTRISINAKSNNDLENNDSLQTVQRRGSILTQIVPSKVDKQTSILERKVSEWLSVLFRKDLSLSALIILAMVRIFQRSTQCFDQLSDLLLALNLIPILSKLDAYNVADKFIIYCIVFVPILPYIALSIVLYKAIFSRLLRSYNKWVCHFLYILFAIPAFIGTDIYVYTRYLNSNLAATKYLYQYWGCRTIVEIFLESIPTSIMVTTLLIRSSTNGNAVIDSIPLSLLIFGFITSFLNILCRFCELKYAASTYDKSLWRYVSEHLFQFSVLPWTDGLKLNQIVHLHIGDDLSNAEWVIFLNYLKVNTSLQSITFDGCLGRTLSLSIFRTLANNNLTCINLKNAMLCASIVSEHMSRECIKAILPEMDIEIEEIEEIEMKSDVNDNDSPLSKKKSKIFKISADTVAIELAKLIDTNDDLNELNLCNNSIGGQSLVLFGPIIHLSASIRKLDLSYNNLSEQTCGLSLGMNLANIIINCKKLHLLRLDGNGLRDKELYAMLDGFRERSSTIRTVLTATRNYFTNEVIQVVTECIEMKHEPQRKMIGKSSKAAMITIAE